MPGKQVPRDELLPRKSCHKVYYELLPQLVVPTNGTRSSQGTRVSSSDYTNDDVMYIFLIGLSLSNDYFIQVELVLK